jgi:hypothetical protein
VAASEAAPAQYSPPSSTGYATELNALELMGSVVVPDTMAAVSEAAAKANAASVTFNLLRSVIKSESLGLKPLEVTRPRFYSCRDDL